MKIRVGVGLLYTKIESPGARPGKRISSEGEGEEGMKGCCRL